MAGRGGIRALRERFGMHEWAPPTAGVNFVVLGATGRGGLNRGPAMAHRIGTGEPCPPMEEQRGWSPGQEDPSGIVHGVGVPALLAISPC